MSLAWLTATFLAVGPVLSPIDGGTVTAADRDILPSGRHLGSMADLWFVELVNQQVTSMDVAAFDPLALSAHGRSWTAVHYLLNGLDITDPSRPGQPLFTVPYEAWDRMTFRSLWTATPGFDFEFLPAPDSSPQRLSFGLATGQPFLGQKTLVPDGLMDREPAFSSDPSSHRRMLDVGAELRGTTSWQGQGAYGRLSGELIGHQNHYPDVAPALVCLTPSQCTIRQQENLDLAQKNSLLSATHLSIGGHGLDVMAGWQQQTRSHAGAEFRWPAAWTGRESTRTAILNAHTAWQLEPGLELDIKAGVGLKQDDANAALEQPRVRDLAGEWLYFARPSWPEDLRRTKANAAAVLTWRRENWATKLALNADYAWMASDITIPFGREAFFWTDAGQGSARPALIRVYEPTRATHESLAQIRPSTSIVYRCAATEAEITAALDVQNVGARRESQWLSASAVWGAAWRWHFSSAGEVFALVRQEPQSLDAQIARFLDPAATSSRDYLWSDNGDQIPDTREAGSLVRRSGGLFHRLDPDVRRPLSRQFGMGMATGTFGPFRAVITGVGRWLIRPLTVRYNDAVAASFVPTLFHDPGGDGRGETRVAGGGQDLIVYAREPGTEGTELYVLTNGQRSDYYLGVETQLLSAADTWWFLNFGGAAYVSVGSAPFGSFYDRSDPGIIDESSADPNARIHQRGRFDADRSFALKMLTGVRPWDSFSAALVVRYRDGQPFVRIVVDPDLPQGPTPIMAVDRGKTRFTFHMTVDARFRWEYRGPTASLETLLDIYNLLNSGTEILEDPRTGSTFRDAVETVPGRGVLAQVALRWL